MENSIQNNSTSFDQPIQIIKRSAIIALIIGSVLSILGQSNVLFGGADIQILPMILAFLTPLTVVAFSQVFGIRAARRALSINYNETPYFVRTLFSHGIPARAVATGLVAGGTNTFIVVIAILLTGQGIDQLPTALILQALTLPIIFGALSQALSFRRTISQSISKPNLNSSP